MRSISTVGRRGIFIEFIGALSFLSKSSVYPLFKTAPRDEPVQVVLSLYYDTMRLSFTTAAKMIAHYEIPSQAALSVCL